MKMMKSFVFIFFCVLMYSTAQASVTIIPDQSIANQFTRHTVTGITKSLPQLPDVTGYPGASYLTIGDIDGDGVKEIICTSGVGIDGNVMTSGDSAVAIFKRTSSGLGSWMQAIINQTFAFANETVLRDMDGDGDKDIMVLDNFILGWYLCGTGGIYWLENLGGNIMQPSNWVKRTIYIEPADGGKCPCSPIGMGTCNSRLTSYHRAIFLDLDGDGDEDFVTTKNHMWYWQWKYNERQYLWMEWFRNEGGANFTGPYQIGNGGGFLFDMADIDDDGDLDIVAPQFFIYKAGFVRFPAGDPRGDSLIWYENPGASVLAANPNTAWNRYVIDNEWTSPNPTGKNNEAIFADIDNDGALEIVVTNHNHQQYSSYSGSPLRYWPAGVYYFEIPANPKTLYPNQWTPITIDKSDPNLNPNDYDAVLADVYGVDRDFEDYNGQGSPGMVRAHDVNGDGFPELLVPGDGKGKLYYYESSASTSSNLIFKRAALYADVGCMPGEAKFDDIDGDGDIDVVAAIYDTRAVKDLNLPTTSASIFVFEKKAPPSCNYIPAALETITAEDGSIWERVNVPGFGTQYNVAIVAMCPYQGSLYALTRNDETGFELWRTTCNGAWERVLVPQFTQNDFYGWLKQAPFAPINRKYNLKQNTWGDMIEFKGKLYVAISSGYQGAQMYGSIGLEIWSFDGEYWLPVVSKHKSVKDASARTGTLTAISSCANNDGTYTAVLTDANKSSTWTTNQWAGGVLEVEGTFSDGTKGLRIFNIISNTNTALTVQENERADTDEFTICAEHKIPCDPGRPAYNVPAIAVGAKYRIWKGTNGSGFGEIWNKSIVDFEIFNDELYATIGLNYEDGTRVWKTADGINWVPTSQYSFGRFHGYDPNGNPTGFCLIPGLESRNGSPVSSSSTKMIKSAVTGTETLFTGGTGSSGCNGRGARVARLDGNQWNLIVDYFVDTNNTGTNENGFGDDGGNSFAYANFQAWSWANYDGLLFTGIARLSGGARIMYTATGSTDDGAWVYAVGGNNPIYPDGFGDVNNIAFNLFPYRGALYAGSLANSQLNNGGPVDGGDIWKATGPGTNLTWTRVTGNAFGDNNTVAFEAFTVFNGALYVAGSNMVPSQVWGEEPAVYSGAKIYRLVIPPQCGNGIVESGEECEENDDCPSGYVCNNCQCEEIPQPVCGNGIIEPGEQCEQNSDCGQNYECIECQCQEKTLIDLISFEAIPGAGTVTLKWETASEIDNAGFNIYRSEAANGPYVKINDNPIPAKGTATQGDSYKFVDTGVQNRKTYYYMLEDVDIAGTTRMHGPKEATPRLIYLFEIK